MPPTRRSRPSSGPAAKGAQKVLTFSSSKSSSTHGALPKDLKPSSTPTPPVHIVPSEAAPVAKSEIGEGKVDEGRIKAGVEAGKTAEEQLAAKVSEAQIKRYWRDREAERRAPRVHLEGVAVEEKILRLFDMSSQFGPAMGLTRVKRWNRAHRLGLSPPIEVLAVLLRAEAKGNTDVERAYVDELMSSKFVVGEA